MNRAYKDKVLGHVLTKASRRGKNVSTTMFQMGNMEEGKKRTE